jgi:kynurenine formamidase
MHNIIDLTQIIDEGMPVYPGDDLPRLWPTRSLKEDHYNDDRLEISMHTGTHVDGPMHLTESQLFIADLPMDSFIGEGCILDVRGQSIIDIKPVYQSVIPEKSIVLLYTGYAEFYGQTVYYQSHPTVSDPLCHLLIEKKIKLLGMDIPSPDQAPFLIHKELLKSGIYIVENLINLEKIPARTKFEVTVLPLKIKANSSPARVIARF